MKTKTWQEEFDEKFEEATIPIETDSGWANNSCSEEIKQFISDLIAQTREETIKEVEKRIIKIKETVRKNSGSYKYDDCYDDCLDILKNLTK